jgi:hypothetical protein
MGATNPPRWSGVLKVKNPAGVTEGLIPLDSNAWAAGQSKLEYFADCLSLNRNADSFSLMNWSFSLVGVSRDNK